MKTRTKLIGGLALALSLPVVSLVMAQQAGVGRGGAAARQQGPCDIYAAGGTPCVTAHSTTRALLSTYNGPLYQVMRESDGKTLDIGIISEAGGYADAHAQDAFCADTLCYITKIYDQSGKENHLVQAPPGTFFGPAKGGFNTLSIADMAPVTVNGQKVYGVYVMPGMGYRNNNAKGLAINDEPEGIYAVVDGTHYDNGCCFNYGNTSTNSRAVGTGTMETVYFGTSTTWGSGSGPGPWIMSDMEAGLFSGYNARQNPATPTIDGWRFVMGIMNGGGGNKWDLRGANAQGGQVSTYYSGIRPGSQNNNSYFPMNKKGAVQMGNGGDNGNGSAGTFYEGVMTVGYPTDASINAVHANVVAAKYDVQRVKLSRVKTFTPGSSQDITHTFTNSTGAPATGVKLSMTLPSGWTAVVAGTSDAAKTFPDAIAPGATVTATFKVTASSAATSGGFLTARAEWTNPTRGAQSDTASTRVRSAHPIKINEVQALGLNNQFIELYNAGTAEVDISNWTLTHTQSQWAGTKLATIPAGTKIAAGGHYLLALASSGLAAPAAKGDTTIHVRSTAGFEVGQEITIGGETRKITKVGTAASPLTYLFVPVSTGPWLNFPAGTTNLPVTSAAGFAVGEKVGIDIGGNFEIVTATAVGKASTQTNLSEPAAAGASTITIATANLTEGDKLTINTGTRVEVATVKSIPTPAAAPAPDPAAGGRGARGGRGGARGGPVELAAPLKLSHQNAVDVSSPGTGITFTPATKFAHLSGDAIQALGSGITLDAPLANDHPYGAPVINRADTTNGYVGSPAPKVWFGSQLSNRSGSIALMDASGKVVVDAIVYGSAQTNSSANGTIPSPDLATLEGEQGQGGCRAVVPNAGRGGRGGAPAAGAAPSRSVARTSDGADTDSNCADFQLQDPTPGEPNKKPV